jgi:transketolase
MVEHTVAELQGKARAIRRHVIEMTANAGVGHQGGPMSAADMFAALYFNVLRVDPHDPKAPDRDRFVLSKGHAASGFYATLAERGFFPVDELLTFGLVNSRLQLHPDMHMLPGVEASTGSLGQGISIAVGIAVGGKMDKQAYRVYCMISDGESQEGQVWEAAMFAGNHKLDNLTVILDNNDVQQCGNVSIQNDVHPLADKWRAFHWNVLECNGHDIGAFLTAIDQAKATSGRPTVIIARTTKGKGVSFMEGDFNWHSKPLTKDLAQQALQELAAGGVR